MNRQGFAIQTVYQREQDEAENQQDERRLIRAGIIGGLNAIINVDRNCAGDSRNVAAHHEHDAEFSHGVGET